MSEASKRVLGYISTRVPYEDNDVFTLASEVKALEQRVTKLRAALGVVRTLIRDQYLGVAAKEHQLIVDRALESDGAALPSEPAGNYVTRAELLAALDSVDEYREHGLPRTLQDELRARADEE